jgi:Na+/melibiose symporter-like transporter
MTRLSSSALFAYGLFGLPLALVALPVYVYVPQYYAERFGLPLTAIGIALLVARVLDALIDPAIGLWIDGAKTPSRQARLGGYGRFVLLSLPALCAGFIALFHPPAQAAAFPLAWFVAALLTVYIGFSIATIAYQSWGAALTQQPSERSRLSASREACGLGGVVLAAVLPVWLGLEWLSVVFVVALAAGATVLLLFALRPTTVAVPPPGFASLAEPFRNRQFRWLFAAFAVNGIAAAIPATLFMFFAKDRLQLPAQAGLFLVLYFIAAAASMPLWVALARRFGEANAWLVSMLLSVAAFVWTYGLSAGEATAFGVICVMSGFALGADLALPPALLAAVIGRAGHSGQREGAYFGAWNWATKMNLALAAGITLPLLARLGYVPGTSSPDGMAALGVAYALLPCGLKLAAAAVLWRAPLKNL